MSRLPPRRALAAVALALLVPLAWQLGRLAGRGDAVPDLDGAVGAAATPGGGDAASGDDPSPLERTAAERDVALAAVERLEGRLAEATRVASDDAAELALYRRIESGTDARGLSIDAVMLVGRGTPDVALAVTLVQSRGRHRVTGSLSARLLDAGPAAAVDAGGKASGGADGAGEPEEAAGTPLGDGPAPFDLRFFQTVRVPLGAAAATLDPAAGPPRVELDVRPDGDRHARLVAIVALDPTVESASGE